MFWRKVTRIKPHKKCEGEFRLWHVFAPVDVKAIAAA
jgi:hypothetical protein